MFEPQSLLGRIATSTILPTPTSGPYSLGCVLKVYRTMPRVVKEVRSQESVGERGNSGRTGHGSEVYVGTVP